MRLLNVRSSRMEEFNGDNIPPYAVLSHTWNAVELTFQDLKSWKYSLPFWRWPSKVSGTCKLARDEGIRYVWIDSCCIDKTNSAELSEAINSMFPWYRRAEVCYVYLSDVIWKEGKEKSIMMFRESRWFTRGWTLQELIAPADLCFYDQSWRFIGTKFDLARTIQQVTGIPRSFLLGAAALEEASVAQRFAWASKRQTTRIEDRAYCLLGLFGVNMPMIYGEEEQSMVRLQQEIMKESDDQSIMARGYIPEGTHLTFESVRNGLLAYHPADFGHCQRIVPLRYAAVSGFEFVSGQLKLPVTLYKPNDGTIVALINCQSEEKPGRPLALKLREVRPNNFERIPGSRPEVFDGPLESPLHSFQVIQLLKPQQDLTLARSREHWIHVEELPRLLSQDIYLAEIVPENRWMPNWDMIATTGPMADGGPTTILRYRFRGRKDRYDDIVAVLTMTWTEAQPRVWVSAMSLSHTIKTSRLLEDFGKLKDKYKDQIVVASHKVRMRFLLTTQTITGQSTFVLRAEKLKLNPDGVATVDGTIPMLQMQLERLKDTIAFCEASPNIEDQRRIPGLDSESEELEYIVRYLSNLRVKPQVVREGVAYGVVVCLMLVVFVAVVRRDGLFRTWEDETFYERRCYDLWYCK